MERWYVIGTLVTLMTVSDAAFAQCSNATVSGTCRYFWTRSGFFGPGRTKSFLPGLTVRSHRVRQ